MKVTCPPGYYVEGGATELICLNDGTWTDNAGVCEPLLDIASEIKRQREIEEENERKEHDKHVAKIAAGKLNNINLDLS